MTRQQIIEAINQLSVAERVALIEAVSRRLREEMDGAGARPSGAREPEVAEAVGNGSDGVSLSRQLYGALKFDGLPPTDEEVKDIIAEYLSEKYS